MAKINVYEMVTKRVLEEMKNGNIPWLRPWTEIRDGAYSRATGKSYSLLNQFLMPAGEYATFKQINEAGGKVKAGEKGHQVVFWKIFKNVDEESGIEKTIPMLRYFTVFNVETQCEGIEKKWSENERSHIEGNKEADEIIKEYVKKSGVRYVESESNEAYYKPSIDKVVVPCKDQFKQQAEFYSTAFHELTHSTGSANRLNRINSVARFGSEEYSREELVAEMGAAALVSLCGMETKSSFRNNAAYIQSWSKAIKNDPKMFVIAAGKADKAIEMILE